MLGDIRDKIDSLDDEIISLLEKRMKLIDQIASHKRTLTDKEREELILSKCPTKETQDIYRSIFEISKMRMKNQSSLGDA